MTRLDLLLVKQNHAKSRTEAASLIKEGRVKVNGVLCQKPSQSFEYDCIIEVEHPESRYVSRGGYKLEKAIETFGINVNNQICLDIGASTGGFTDCLLQKGAGKVYAVDCGHSQLDERLKGNPKVINTEETNARFLKKTDFGDEISLIVMDVSFISQTLIYPACKDILPEGGEMVTLIKPQFELDRSKVSKKGIVKDEKGVYLKQIKEKITAASGRNGFILVDITDSPISGGDGNREYLAYFIRRNINEGNNLPQPEQA